MKANSYLLASVATAAATASAALIGERAPAKYAAAPESLSFPLRRVSLEPNHDSAAAHLRRRRYLAPDQDTRPTFGIDNLRNEQDLYYVIDLKVGGQTVPVSVDTGSADTWFIGAPLMCVNPFSGGRKNNNCGFAAPFRGNFSYGMIPDEIFSISYGDGTFVSGTFGYEDISLGGVTATRQQVALVSYSYWFGDGIVSGLMGLAYPLMTGLGNGRKEYDPIFWNLWKNNISSPFFSLSLSREEMEKKPTFDKPHGAAVRESYLAFGGVPPTDFDDSSWSRTPIQSMQVLEEYGVTTPSYGLYVIFADAYVYGHPGNQVSGPMPITDKLTVNATQFPVLIDAGATLTRLPRDLAFIIYRLFDPPAELVRSTGLFYAPCNATVPAFGVQIGSQVYYMSKDDLLRQNARDEETGTLCRIGITDSNFGPWILGVTFLTNVVAVFDVEENEMRFAARTHYPSPEA